MSVETQSPRDGNTGATFDKTKRSAWSLDWLECTFKHGLPSIPKTFGEKVEGGFPKQGYTECQVYSTGFELLQNPQRPDMGYHVIFSGSTLKNIDDQEVMDFCIQADKITRLDVAIDVYNHAWTIAHFKRAHSAGKIKTTAREIHGWNDWNKPGDTLYVGRKASKKMTRIYDKAAQLKLDMDWWRVETVFKHPHAQKALHGLKTQKMTAVGLIRGHVDIDRKWWKTVMDSEPIKTVAGTPERQTEKWLLSQAAPALARIMHENGDHDFYIRFIEHVRELYEQFDNKTNDE